MAKAEDASEIGRREIGWASEPAPDELRTLQPNRVLLERIASETGGELVALGQLDDFVARLPNRKLPVVEPWTYPLWHQWKVFLFAISCLAGSGVCGVGKGFLRNRSMPSLFVYASLLLGGGIEGPAPAADAPSVLVVVGAPARKNTASSSANGPSSLRGCRARISAVRLDRFRRDRRAGPGGSQPTTSRRTETIRRGVLAGADRPRYVRRQDGAVQLRGPDVSAGELAEWLKPFERPLAIINCASASGPFINSLSGPNRAVVTATKSGFEHNFARFGDYLSQAMADPKADLDKDKQTSLLEAFLLASAGAREFYASESRLATEHALLDDNGDALGTAADWFKGIRAVKSARDGAAPDGPRAAQLQLVPSDREQRLPPEARTRRDEIERQLAQLREQKAKLAEEEYYSRLEALLVELARLYEPFDTPAEEACPPAARACRRKVRRERVGTFL